MCAGAPAVGGRASAATAVGILSPDRRPRWLEVQIDGGVAVDGSSGQAFARARHAFFTLTVVLVVFAIVVQVVGAATSHGGHFATPAGRAFNVFAYFTIQSNLIIAATCLALALRPDSDSTWLRTFRLTGLACIVITGVVYNTALAGLVEMHGWGLVADRILHIAVPVLAVVGWLVFGPRRLVSWRIVWLAFVYPLAWVAFTLARGAAVHWYPYPFIDIDSHGYARVALNIVAITVLFIALCAGALWLDRRLATRREAKAASG
jgi:hypothetical protein